MSIENNTTTETLALNPVELLVQDFQGRMASDETTMQDFQIKGWEVVWNQVQEAYRVSRLIILDDENKAFYKAALEKAGLKLPSGTANQWLPVTKLLFGKWNVLNSIFTPDRSAEKYANYFRYFELNGVPADEVVDTIRGAVHGDLRYLKAIEKMDREDNGVATKGFTPEAKLQAGLNRNAPDVFKIAKPALVDSSTEYGVLVFERDGDDIVIITSEELTKDAFEAKARKRGASLLSKVNDLGKDIALKLALGEKVAA